MIVVWTLFPGNKDHTLTAGGASKGEAFVVVPFQCVVAKPAGEVLTAKQAPHRPGTAPALGLRAGSNREAGIIPASRAGRLRVVW
jgi:hypothetical protein